MSVYGEIRNSTVAPVGEMVASVVLACAAAMGAGVKAVGSVGRALERRRVLAQLSSFDDHMLSDIGLTRSDLRDATSAPLLADPTRVLVLRATERRAAARLAQREKAV